MWARGWWGQELTWVELRLLYWGRVFLNTHLSLRCSSFKCMIKVGQEYVICPVNIPCLNMLPYGVYPDFLQISIPPVLAWMLSSSDKRMIWVCRTKVTGRNNRAQFWPWNEQEAWTDTDEYAYAERKGVPHEQAALVQHMTLPYNAAQGLALSNPCNTQALLSYHSFNLCLYILTRSQGFGMRIGINLIQLNKICVARTYAQVTRRVQVVKCSAMQRNSLPCGHASVVVPTVPFCQVRQNADT